MSVKSGRRGKSRWFYELIDGASLIVVVTQPDGKRQYSMPLWLFQELGAHQWIKPGGAIETQIEVTAETDLPAPEASREKAGPPRTAPDQEQQSIAAPASREGEPSRADTSNAAADLKHRSRAGVQDGHSRYRANRRAAPPIASTYRNLGACVAQQAQDRRPAP